MILSNIEIQKAIDDRRLIIDPDPQPRGCEHPTCPYDTTAVDLHLGNSISIPRAGPFAYDLRQPGIATFLSRNCDHIEVPVGGYVLAPKVFVLGTTLERVCLPIIQGQTLAARIEGKSSFARCGLLVHFTAPTVHAGFEGTLTLEMINLGSAGISLFAGMPICQLILEVVAGDPQAHPSQFQGQATPSGI
jgi:dCTP deaminase